MKTILVATDFSGAAHNACVYAMELATVFNARLVLFSAYQQVPVPVMEAPVVLSSADMGVYVQERLAEEVRVINRGNTLPVETVCMEGLAIGGILKTAKDYHADIIIAGMKENGKGFRKIFGSTVTALADRVTIPLIVVPATARYEKVEAIALANERDIDPDADMHVFDALREIGEKFGSRLYLVRVAENGFRGAYELQNRPRMLQRRLRELAPEYKCIEGKDIPKTLHLFTTGYHINMLALLPHQYSPPEKWFIKSITRSLIFETRIPLLVLPHKAQGEES